MSQYNNKNISKSFWVRITLIPIGMFLFAFAMVPLYETFCDITGLNGRTSSSAYQGEKITIDEKRTVTVDFLSAASTGFPVTFHPVTKRLKVVPGKIYTVNYYAENRSDKVIVGQAIPSVAPGVAAAHLKKLECFCYNNQKFEPKKPVEMPVRFFVDSKLDKEIKNITLSYNFLAVKSAEAKKLADL